MSLNLKKEIDIEKFVGIRIYSTDTPSIGGKIKKYPEDFIVQEIIPNGQVLSISPESYNVIHSESGRRRFTDFVLIKKNNDTFHAVKKLAYRLNVRQSDFFWAGIKDNRAITAQKACVKGDFLNILSKIKIDNIDIRDLRYRKKAIKVGSLWGNHFSILLRDIIQIDNIDNVISENSKILDNNGFPNFYGLQRFGTFRPNSHIVGKFLFLGEYENAVKELVFKIYPKEIEESQLARKRVAKEQDFQAALEYFPKSLRYEYNIIKALAEHPNDYKNALKTLPDSLLNLVMSSYQGYLFNRAISRRVENGDKLHIPIDGDKIALSYDKYGTNSPVVYTYGKWDSVYLSKYVKNGMATILCPIIGYNTILTDNYFSEIYNKILEEENFELDFFRNSELASLVYKGTNRPIFVKPMNFSAEIDKKNKSKEKINLKLKFSLPKGTYATMLLREYTKGFENA